jgi:hypothetical protein
MSLYSQLTSAVVFIVGYHGIQHCPFIKPKFEKIVKIVHTIAQNPPKFD